MLKIRQQTQDFYNSSYNDCQSKSTYTVVKFTNHRLATSLILTKKSYNNDALPQALFSMLQLVNKLSARLSIHSPELETPRVFHHF